MRITNQLLLSAFPLWYNVIIHCTHKIVQFTCPIQLNVIKHKTFLGSCTLTSYNPQTPRFLQCISGLPAALKALLRNPPLQLSQHHPHTPHTWTHAHPYVCPSMHQESYVWEKLTQMDPVPTITAMAWLMSGCRQSGAARRCVLFTTTSLGPLGMLRT